MNCLSTCYKGISSCLSGVKSCFSHCCSKKMGLSEELAKIQANIAILQEIESLQRKHSTNQTQISDLKGRIESLEKDDAELLKKIAHLTSMLNKSKAEQDRDTTVAALMTTERNRNGANQKSQKPPKKPQQDEPVQRKAKKKEEEKDPFKQFLYYMQNHRASSSSAPQAQPTHAQSSSDSTDDDSTMCGNLFSQTAAGSVHSQRKVLNNELRRRPAASQPRVLFASPGGFRVEDISGGPSPAAFNPFRQNPDRFTRPVPRNSHNYISRDFPGTYVVNLPDDDESQYA
jgi:hypothetical protein